MWAFSNKVAIAGVGYSALTRRSETPLLALAADAVDAACADAGLTRQAVDALVTSPGMPRYGGVKGTVEGVDVVNPWFLGEHLGIADRVLYTGSTNGMVTQGFIDAAMAVASGACTHAVVYRALHVPPGSYVNYESKYAADQFQYFAPYGFSGPPAWAATVLRRYFELYGYSREDMARYIVDNRANCQLNPNGYWRGKPLTREDYLGARMIADPMSILDCDIPVDGCAALLLTSTERARDLQQVPALLSGFAAGTVSPPFSVPMTLEDLMTGCEQVAQRLWTQTGLGPQDFDNAQLYDGFSPFVFIWLEGLGIVPKGEGLAFLRDGNGALGGKLPINTGGGALGEGRLHGMTQLAEAAVQVTGRAGARQVPGAKRAIATISNGSTKSTGFVICRDEGQ
ncbi:MAG: thiolase C-terminal domain-containing protein [Novosphingobium sp.]